MTVYCLSNLFNYCSKHIAAFAIIIDSWSNWGGRRQQTTNDRAVWRAVIANACDGHGTQTKKNIGALPGPKPMLTCYFKYPTSRVQSLLFILFPHAQFPRPLPALSSVFVLSSLLISAGSRCCMFTHIRNIFTSDNNISQRPILLPF